jgi:type VI secretion system protein ImpJ
MYLGPHHFQAQAAFFENTVQFTTTALHGEPYGLAGLEMDVEALRNGAVALVHARGMMPDGLVFQMPESDSLPAPRQAAEVFPPTRNQLVVHLAVPAHLPGAANCTLAGEETANACRFISEQRSLADENSGADEKPVQLGRKNMRLLFEHEQAESMVRMPVARVVRDGAAGFRYDETFIPPCLKISASARLMDLLGRLVLVLSEKSAWLSATARGKGRFPSGLSPQQVATFWFLHAINSGLAPLRAIHLSQQGHPEELFVELLRLAGALCTFSLESQARALPVYDHANLTDCFESLDRHVRTHLEIIIPTNCIPIPLAREAEWIHEGAVNDPRCLGASRWFLAIRSPVGEGELIRLTPKLAKLCSAQFVPELVRRALPGMTLTHVPNPPAAISPHVDWQYFSVDRSGPCWEHILQTKRLAVYLPVEIPKPEAEVLVLLES